MLIILRGEDYDSAGRENNVKDAVETADFDEESFGQERGHMKVKGSRRVV